MSILYISFGLVFLLLQGVRIKKRKVFDVVDYTAIWFIVSFFIVPFYLYFFHSGFNRHYPAGDDFIKKDDFVFFMMVFVSYCFFYLGIFFGKTTCGMSLRQSSSELKNKRLLIALFFFTLFSILVFIHGYGGLFYVLENISRIRSGVDSNKDYLAALFKRFSYFFDFCFFALLAMLMSKPEKVRGNKILKFLISFVFIFVFFRAFLAGGRQQFINIFVGLLFLSSCSHKTIGVIKPAVVIFVSVLLVFFGKSLVFQIFSGKELGELAASAGDKASLDLLVSQLSHPFLGMVTAMQEGLGERMGVDLVLWFLKPFKLLGFEVEDSISYYHTYILTGEWDSVVPPGVIGFSLYQGGVAFMVLYVFLLGWFISFFNSLTQRFRGGDYIVFAFYVSVSLWLPLTITMADPALLFQIFIPYIVIFPVLVMFKCFRFVK